MKASAQLTIRGPFLGPQSLCLLLAALSFASPTFAVTWPLKSGAWHFAPLVVKPHRASLFLNGKPAGTVQFTTLIPATEALGTPGGIWDAEHVRQAFHSALDDCAVHERAFTEEEIGASYRPVPATHALPAPAELPLGDSKEKLLNAAKHEGETANRLYAQESCRKRTDGDSREQPQD